jgi:hypothetical protein
VIRETVEEGFVIAKQKRGKDEEFKIKDED